MPSRDPRVDAYIARSAAFAQPILQHVRAVVHAACPTVEETIKWSFPFFLYRGRMLCHMSAFKTHAAFGFFRDAAVLGEARTNRGAMGSFGRLTRVADLPPRRELATLVKRAVTLGDAAPTQRRRVVQPAPKAPPALAALLAKNAKLRRRWEALPPGYRREYVEWLLSARQEATRARRLALAITRIAAGKTRDGRLRRKTAP